MAASWKSIRQPPISGPLHKNKRIVAHKRAIEKNKRITIQQLPLKCLDKMRKDLTINIIKAKGMNKYDFYNNLWIIYHSTSSLL